MPMISSFEVLISCPPCTFFSFVLIFVFPVYMYVYTEYFFAGSNALNFFVDSSRPSRVVTTIDERRELKSVLIP